MKRYMNFGGRFFNAGGAMPMNQLTEFNEGGRHEENGLGGIPQGMNPDGQMNLVEEGETKFNAENYIFSDTLKVDKELAEAFNLSPKMVGKTFADASKMAGRKKSKREGDAIEEAANNRDLQNLMEAQEAFKQKEIQEKLAEIDALDPNVLPAMMGQGQPQGDPAMGGQMQEASMMDQEAMMAQQNEPSPEEMAMMQNEMMGQQEGMMRSGGKIPKSVLLSRAKSHMSDAAAQEYVKNYDNGGNLGGPYPRHSIGLGYKRPVYPMTEEEARRQKIYEGPYKDHVEMLNDIDLAFDNPTALVTGEPLAGEKSSFKDYLKWWDSPKSYRPTRKDEWPEAEKLGGYLGDGKSSFGGGGYMSRSYAPGGFMGMNMANAGMMNANPNPCGDPPLPPCPGQETGFTSTIKTRDTGSAIQDFSPHLSWTEEAGFEDDRIMQDIRQSMISNLGAVGTSTDPAYGDGTGIGEFPDKERTGKFKDFVGKVKDNFVDKRENIRDFRKKPNTAGRRYTHVNRALNVFRPKNDRISNSGNMRFAVKHPRATQDAQGNNLRALSNLFLGVPDKSKWVGRFGEDKMRRGGGKLCYGCGGAMHAYGGRIDGMNQMATGGEILAGIGSGALGTLKLFGSLDPTGTINKGIDATHDFLQERAGLVDPNDPGQDIVYNVGSTAGNIGSMVLSGGTSAKTAASDIATQTGDLVSNVGEITGNENLETAGKAIDTAGQIGSMFLGNAASGAGAATDAATDIASTAEDAAEFGSKIGKFTSNKGVEAGLNVGTDLLTSQTKKAEAERLAEEERRKIERDMQMTNDPNSIYYNPTVARYGKKLGNGGGLWANIRAKKERMGSNYRPAKVGDPDRPDQESWEKAQKPMGGHLYYPGGYLFGPAGDSTTVVQQDESDEFTYAYPDPTEALEQTPLQQAAIYAPLVKNIYDATLAKTGDYVPDFVPSEYVQLDSAAAIQQEKQRSAGITAAARAKGFNNPSVLLALNQQLQGKVSEIQAKYDEANAKFKQAAKTEDVKEKRRLGDLKESLKMQLDEAKNLAANEAALQAKQIAENKTANKLALLYATMGAPDMGVNFRSSNKKALKLQKELEKLQKEIAELKKRKK